MRIVIIIITLFIAQLAAGQQKGWWLNGDTLRYINGIGDTVQINKLVPTMVGQSGKLLSNNGTNYTWVTNSAGATRVFLQQDVTNSNATPNTLADITGLTANVAAGKIYRFEAKLYTTSNVAGGVKVAIAGTATATAIVYEGLTTDAGLITQSRGTALGTAVGAVTAVTAGYITISGTITVNAAGTLTVQFAQNASNGTASSILVGSTFVITEML